MRKILKRCCCVVLTAFFIAISLTACSNNDKERLCAHPWESSGGFYEFHESGKISYNFESEDTSVSYYKLLPGKKINMYTQEGEDFGIVFDYSFKDGKLYIGGAEYKKAERIDLESIERELEEKKKEEVSKE